MNDYIGTVLPGYCNGFFGRTYTSKTIEAIGKDWIVARDDEGPWIATFDSSEQRDKMLKEWTNGEEG
jgi:hypothetical protein